MDTTKLIKKAIPRVRKFKDKLRVKNLQSFDVARLLTKDGWKQIGRVDYDKGTEYGFQKGTSFVKIADWGEFPYYLGDTLVYPDQIFNRTDNRQTGASIR